MALALLSGGAVRVPRSGRHRRAFAGRFVGLSLAGSLVGLAMLLLLLRTGEPAAAHTSAPPHAPVPVESSNAA